MKTTSSEFLISIISVLAGAALASVLAYSLLKALLFVLLALYGRGG